MAIMRHSIIFGGVDSADYGIYIGGEGVFNAPKREVEMIEIPGRNGAFALDKGRFENITVEYTAINHEPDLSTFSANLDAFRNALSAQKGYQRLTDTFHPDEYRMATFREGLEIEPIEYNTASEFKIKFDCKPQRFLMSGETAVSVSSGGTLTNPTLFESSPLLEIKGEGAVNIGDVSVTLSGGTVGYVVLDENIIVPNKVNVSFAGGLVGASDNINVSGLVGEILFKYGTANGISSIAITDNRNLIALESEMSEDTTSGRLTLSFADFSLTKGSNFSGTGTIRFTLSDSSIASWLFGYTLRLGNDLRFNMTVTPASGFSGSIGNWRVAKIDCNSTAQILGTPTYIDCDIGEAYRIDASIITSLNRFIELGSNLPVLSVGNTEITYDNTITEVKVTPRWWKV